MSKEEIVGLRMVLTFECQHNLTTLYIEVKYTMYAKPQLVASQEIY